MTEFSFTFQQEKYPLHSKILIDGEELHGVQTIKFFAGVDDLPTVEIEGIEMNRETRNGRTVFVPVSQQNPDTKEGELATYKIVLTGGSLKLEGAVDDLVAKHILTEEDGVLIRKFTASQTLQKMLGQLADRGVEISKVISKLQDQGVFIDLVDILGWDIDKLHGAVAAIMNGISFERSVAFAQNIKSYSTSINDPTTPEPPTLSPS